MSKKPPGAGDGSTTPTLKLACGHWIKGRVVVVVKRDGTKLYRCDSCGLQPKSWTQK